MGKRMGKVIKSVILGVKGKSLHCRARSRFGVPVGEARIWPIIHLFLLV